MDTDALQSTQSDMLVTSDDVPLDAEAERLRQAIVGYLLPEDVAHIDDAIRLARQARAESAGVTDERATGVLRRDFAYVLAVAQTLAEALHIDAITLAAVLLDQVVEARLTDLGEVRAQLGRRVWRAGHGDHRQPGALRCASAPGGCPAAQRPEQRPEQRRAR